LYDRTPALLRERHRPSVVTVDPAAGRDIEQANDVTSERHVASAEDSGITVH